MSSGISSISGTNNLYYLSQMLRQSGSTSSSSALTDVFGSLDENGDGSVSKDEFQTFLSASSTNLTDSVTDSPMDTGGLLGLFGDAARLDSATGSTASTDQLFAKIDGSGDGSISEDELTTFASGLGSGGGTSDTSSIDELFSAIDSDGNGSISEDELKTFASKAESAMSASPPPPPPPPSDSTSSLDSLLESLGLTGSTDGSSSSATTDSSSSGTDQTNSGSAFAAIIMEAIGKYMQFGQTIQGSASTVEMTG